MQMQMEPELDEDGVVMVVYPLPTLQGEIIAIILTNDPFERGASFSCLLLLFLSCCCCCCSWRFVQIHSVCGKLLT